MGKHVGSLLSVATYVSAYLYPPQHCDHAVIDSCRSQGGDQELLELALDH